MKGYSGASGITFGEFPLQPIGRARNLMDEIPDTEGIKVYRANDDTIRKNIELFENNSLTELSIDDACTHHGGCDQ